jgi:16S rRNA (uracil1498-N3)-methyltransferase
MRFHRFLIDTVLASGPLILKNPDLVHQIRSVLRLTVGDSLLLLDGRGSEAEVLIERVEKDRIEVHVGDLRTITTEPQRSVILFCSILRRENFEWVVQKATEIGAVKIVPVLAERTVKTGIRMDRLVRIVREAVEQCGRGVVPTLSEVVDFETALSMAPAKNIFFHLGAEQGIGKALERAGEAGVWIGPEGGWTDAEALKAVKNGFIVSSMGSLALRAETAAVVGTYLAVHA